MSADRALLWFKRDLRLRDHAPLAAAADFAAVAGLFVFEPAWLGSDEFDPMHADFALGCLRELRAALAERGMPLLLRHGPMPAVLDALHADYRFTHLLSHEETGPGWSYARDRRVAGWCRAHGVAWLEMPQTGVVRRLRSRDGWAQRWERRMVAAQAEPPRALPGAAGLAAGPIPTLADLRLPPARALPPAGEAVAWDTLTSFLATRGRAYRRDLSSPLTAEAGCSRLSAHLAFGTISMRAVQQATEARIRHAPPDMAYALRGFASRLRWHCHFMQKLEDQPDIEFRNLSRICDGLRESSFDEARFAAWRDGRTGFPMVDACMRFLRATGWLNFRMRAMLVSFASYHLWLHWRPTGLFLARQFLDFEAGIHWSQMQMQSGTTGINTLRIYAPAKQAREHDPHGVFIRRWVPELARVPLPHLAEPWRMDTAEQRDAGCAIGADYPAPIVHEARAVKAAKDRMFALRAAPAARQEADAIQDRHGSRKAGLPPTTRRRAAPRRGPDLFDGLAHES